MTDSHKRIRKNCICISILLLAGAGLALYLVLSGYEPSGGDIWGHLYKSQEMYESLKKGNVFPLFSPYWYNGIQLFRYWGPLSYYIMAGLMFLTGGDLLLAYRLLAFVIFVVGGLPWILWGIHENRRVLGTFFGLLWFFMPEHIRIYFTAGNLPQMVTTMLVPYAIWFLWLYVRKKNNCAAVGLFVCMTLMSFTHLMVTAIMGVSAFLYLLIDQIWNKDTRRKIFALIYMICGILTAGIWVIPSLKGGLVTSESGDGSVMSTLIYPLTTSLNPFKRLSAGNDSSTYRDSRNPACKRRKESRFCIFTDHACLYNACCIPDTGKASVQPVVLDDPVCADDLWFFLQCMSGMGSLEEKILCASGCAFVCRQYIMYESGFLQRCYIR